MKRFLGLLAAFLFAVAPMAAFAAPIPYYSGPNDVPNVMVNTAINNVNAGFPSTSYTVACSGTTTATCTGTRLQISVTGLTTAAGGTSSAAMTVTDTSVTAASQIFCQPTLYAGTGNPIDSLIVPAAGTFTFVITNVAVSGSLNATVVSNCFVYN